MLHNVLMQDTIERTIDTKADLARAWQAFATPEGLSSWFSERIEGSWAVGEEAVLSWGEHRCRIRIVAFEPMSKFAYEWVPGTASDELVEGSLTQVVFTLSAKPDGGSIIHMEESGFASLPSHLYTEAFGNNDEGWTEELAKLEKLLA